MTLGLTSGVYQGGRQGPAEHQGAVGQGVACAVRVEVCRGPLARVGALDVLVSRQVSRCQVRVKS